MPMMLTFVLDSDFTPPAAAPPPIRTMADAVDRDLLIFHLEQAVQDLRAALSALEPGEPPAA